MREGSHDRISVLEEEIPESWLALFPPGEDTMRRLQSPSEEKSPHRAQPGWHPDLGLPPCRTVTKSVSPI